MSQRNSVIFVLPLIFCSAVAAAQNATNGPAPAPSTAPETTVLSATDGDPCLGLCLVALAASILIARPLDANDSPQTTGGEPTPCTHAIEKKICRSKAGQLIESV